MPRIIAAIAVRINKIKTFPLDRSIIMLDNLSPKPVKVTHPIIMPAVAHTDAT